MALSAPGPRSRDMPLTLAQLHAPEAVPKARPSACTRHPRIAAHWQPPASSKLLADTVEKQVWSCEQEARRAR